MAVDPEKYQYQHGFSDTSSAMYDDEGRTQKAKKTMAVIHDYLHANGKESQNLHLLDIGCSTGYLTRQYGRFFGHTTGIDIDKGAIAHAKKETDSDNIHFQLGDSMDMAFDNNSFDAVTCTQIYEHTPDAKQLMSEIYRVLKPGGFCYFAAGNRLTFMEEHYHLPLLSAIPKWMANYYIRMAGKADFYYETHYSLWGLKKLVRQFEIIDYTTEIIRDPVKYHATEMIHPDSIKQRFSLTILRYAYWICPTYIWILKKPAD